MKLARVLILSTLCIIAAVNSLAQDFLPGINQIRTIQSDTNNYYFKEIWIQSKDINRDDPSGFLRRASDKVELGYNKEALEDVRKAIAIDSTISHSYTLMGLILLRSDSVRRALDSFNKAIALNDTNKYNFLYAAEGYMASGKYHEADSLLNRAIELDRNFFASYFDLANLSLMQGDPEKAEVYYNKVIELDPTFYLAYFNLAVIYSSGDPWKAKRSLEKCIELNPSFANAYYLMGHLEMMMLRKNVAIKNWTRATELSPGNILYHVVLGLTKIDAGDETAGFEDIRKAMENPLFKTFINDHSRPKGNQAGDFLNLALIFQEYSGSFAIDEQNEIIKGLCCFYKGKYSDAEKIFTVQSTRTSAPGLLLFLKGFNYEFLVRPDLSIINYTESAKQQKFPHEVYLRQGILYSSQLRFREAVRPLCDYISYNDSSTAAWLSLGNAYMNLSSYDSAIHTFDILLKLDTVQPLGHFNRAYCYKKKEMYNEAMTDLSKVIMYREYDFEAIGLLAECQYLTGDTTGALGLLDKTFLRFQSLDENGFYLRGSINLWQKQYDSAIVNFTEVTKFRNHHNDVLTLRGLAYFLTGEYHLAKIDLTSATDLNEQDMTATFTLGIVNLRLNENDEAYKNLKKAEALGHPLAKSILMRYLKDYQPPDAANGNL